VFGDTVNTTCHHESTGEAGRVHGSMTTMIELLKQAPDDFISESRGMIEMKGKGSIPTYWISSTADNPLTNEKALEALDEEVATKFADMLAQEECLAKQKKKAAVPDTGVKEDSVEAKPRPIPQTTSHVASSIRPNHSLLSAFRATASTSQHHPTTNRSRASSSDTSFRTELDEDSIGSYYGTMSSGTLSLASNSNLFSPDGVVENQPTYRPTQSELMYMLGQLIDGAAEIDDLVLSIHENFDDDRLNGLGSAMDDALQILEEDDGYDDDE